MAIKKKKLCFVLMPFKKEMKEVYRNAIKPACEQLGFDSLPVDELVAPFNIHRSIIEYIFTSDAIVADLTDWSPNVFYEMGVAHAIGNKTIMIIQKKDSLPFDIRTYPCIKYEQTESGLENLQANIADFLRCIDEWRQEPTNPVQKFKPYEALIPRSDMIDVQKQLLEKEKLFANSVPRTAIDALQKELQELKERPFEADVLVLKYELKQLRSQLKEKEHQIRVIQDKVDKMRTAETKHITPPSDMALIPAGEFMMGTSEKQMETYLKDYSGLKRVWIEIEKPAHKVWLDVFFLDIYLVTNIQYAEFLNDWGKDVDKNGQPMIKEYKWGVRKVKDHWEPQKGFENHPVVYVTWYGAQQYAQWAGKQLPTEAQWEKAARGGIGMEFATKDGSINHKLANYGKKINKTTPITQYPPNPYGLYDMSGNVWEWCQDWFDEKYYEQSPVKNPIGPDEGGYRVLRGGSWSFETFLLRCAYRGRKYPEVMVSNVGFRCAKTKR